MSVEKKIVLIGAGSAMFTQGLVVDLICHKSDIKWHLALVDIERKALNAISRLCEKVIKAKNADVVLTYSLDRKDVLVGADFVVSTIGVGSRRAWEEDVFIPRKYGVYQPVGDSIAPGGISRAMRMIPSMIDITRDIERLCPSAYFFNYANPMTMICTAIKKATNFPVIGLCHGVKNGHDKLSQIAGYDKKDVTSLAVGLNHFTIMYDVRHDGDDLWPAIIENIGEDSDVIGPISKAFIKKHNAFVVTDDRHYSEYLSQYLKKGAYFGKTLGVEAYSFENTIKNGDEIYDKTVEIAYSDKPLPDDYFKKYDGEHEELVNIIYSILNDDRKIYSVNMPNNGAVKNLPNDAVVEMPAVATARGFKQLMIDDYPDEFAEMIKDQLEIIDVVVDAALKGDRELYLKAILMGDSSLDKSQAKAMVDELIKAQSEYLPQF